jgi:ArsR family transcriptional regulator, arsenate/arsenite/antimonite-responsive transcriptional repressor
LEYLKIATGREITPHRASPLYIAKAEFFRTLGHPARVRILEVLRDGERSVGALQAELGLDSGGTSQQLAALRRIGLVESRKEGTSVFYRVADDDVFGLLELARAILGRSAESQRALLAELAAE